MHLPFEQIDEAAGESVFGIIASINGNQIAHRAFMWKIERFILTGSVVRNLTQDNLIAAAAYASE